jgi:hypothetical protein
MLGRDWQVNPQLADHLARGLGRRPVAVAALPAALESRETFMGLPS